MNENLPDRVANPGSQAGPGASQNDRKDISPVAGDPFRQALLAIPVADHEEDLFLRDPGLPRVVEL
jgi:hypothetical protein